MTARQWQARYPEVATLHNLPEWHDLAACKGHPNLDLWFPERGSSTREAKAICFRECPVREACLEWAVEHNPTSGIWGGLSERERRTVRRQRRG